MEEDIDQKIEAYLGGKMAPEEQKQFEKKIAQDPELDREVRLYNEINHHLHKESWLDIKNDKSSEVKQEIEGYIRSEDADRLRLKISQAANRHKKVKSLSKIRYLVASVAAALILGFFMTTFLNRKSNDDLYAEYFSENDLPSMIKRGAQNESLKNGMIAYKTKEYKKALNFFRDYQNEIADTDPLIYAYIGFSYLKTQKNEEALSSFDKLLNSNSLDNSKALWYKTLVYLKTNKKVESKKVLLEIISDSLNFNYAKAKRLLQEID